MMPGNAAATRVSLIVRCRDCGHQVEPDPAEMAARYGAETAAVLVQSAADAARIKGARSRLATTGGKTPISRLGESFAPNIGARNQPICSGAC